MTRKRIRLISAAVGLILGWSWWRLGGDLRLVPAILLAALTIIFLLLLALEAKPK